MKTLSERLNMTHDLRNIPDNAVFLHPREDIAFYETICLFIANNDIETKHCEQSDFDSAAMILQCYIEANTFVVDTIAFWIDNN